MGTFLFLFMASPLIKEQVLSDHNNYYEITSQRQIMALRAKALFRRVQSCKCILIKCCGKKTVLVRGLVVRRIYWQKFPTSFAGSLLFTSQGAREGRPWSRVSQRKIRPREESFTCYFLSRFIVHSETRLPLCCAKPTRNSFNWLCFSVVFILRAIVALI